MAIHRPNAYIDYILRWENRDIIQRRLYRSCFQEGHRFLPEENYAPKALPATGERYFTYTWDAGGAPPEVEIEVLLDRYPPPESKLQPRKMGTLHNHDFFEILYVYSGTCRTIVDGRERELKSGDICLYNLQALHRVIKRGPEDVYFNIMIRRDLFQKSFLDLLAENDMITDFFIQSIYNINHRAGQIVLSPNARYRCEEIVQWMVERHFRNEIMEQSMLKALLVLLLGEMTGQYRAEVTSEEGGGTRGLKLAQVIAYINRHYGSLSMEGLSAHFGYSPRSMTRYIKGATGTTYKQILQQIRFHQACRLLRDTERPIGAIAEASGYAERASFDRAFKQVYHITPHEYRQHYRGEGG